MVKMCIFLEEFDPLRHLSWLAEGGGGARKRLTCALFWPSANSLAWREGGCSPRVSRVCVKLAGAAQSIFPPYARSNQSERQFGKVLGGKSQMIVTSHVAFIEYFVNRLSSLAKWQRTRHPYENADDGRHKGDILNCWIRLSRALRHVR